MVPVFFEQRRMTEKGKRRSPPSPGGLCRKMSTRMVYDLFKAMAGTAVSKSKVGACVKPTALLPDRGNTPLWRASAARWLRIPPPGFVHACEPKAG
jgi:hypothetical protein